MVQVCVLVMRIGTALCSFGHRKYRHASNASNLVGIRAVGGAEEPMSRMVPPPLFLLEGLGCELEEEEVGYAEGSVGQAGPELESGVTVVGRTIVVVPEGDETAVKVLEMNVEVCVLVRMDLVIVNTEDDVGDTVATEGTTLTTVFVAVASLVPPPVSLAPSG